jgi:hypothetical protein
MHSRIPGRPPRAEAGLRGCTRIVLEPSLSTRVRGQHGSSRDSPLEEAGFEPLVPLTLNARCLTLNLTEFAAADSPLEEAVSSELVSEAQIPC